jgi:hypothetical protein
VTHSELAQIRGIGRESAVKLVQRERWRRQPGNDRSVRVLVPAGWLKPAKIGDGIPEGLPEGLGNLPAWSAAYMTRLHSCGPKPLSLAALTRFGAPTKIAFADVRRPFIELHFANVAALGWEGGVTTPVATGVAMGFRHYGYMGALFGLACALDRGVPQASPAQVSPS